MGRWNCSLGLRRVYMPGTHIHQLENCCLLGGKNGPKHNKTTKPILSNLCLRHINTKAVSSIPTWAFSWRVGHDVHCGSNSEYSVNIQSVPSGVISGESAVSATTAAWVLCEGFCFMANRRCEEFARQKALKILKCSLSACWKSDYSIEVPSETKSCNYKCKVKIILVIYRGLLDMNSSYY